MKITVTKKDILEGTRASGKSCPIALACRRAGIDIGNGVGMCFIWADPQIDIPLKVSTFIEKFDDGKPVKPFSFHLKVPSTKRSKR